MDELHTRPFGGDLRAAHMQWVRDVVGCRTDVCEWGWPIRGLLQSGKWVHVVHDPEVWHRCMFRGKISPEMERKYNANRHTFPSG